MVFVPKLPSSSAWLPELQPVHPNPAVEGKRAELKEFSSFRKPWTHCGSVSEREHDRRWVEQLQFLFK